MNTPSAFSNPSPVHHSLGSALPRELFLYAIQSAISLSEFRFAREASLTWLGAYPGDLLAGLYYAQALAGSGHREQALPILDGLCQADPEFEEAVVELAKIQAQLEATQPALAAKSIKRLPGKANLAALHTGQADDVAAWVAPLGQARRALAQGDHAAAESPLHLALSDDPPTPLAAVTHLRWLVVQGETPLPARLSLAAHYHQRWPACLACGLLLADWLMESGEADQAVVLLHQAAARDISGQVATRLWGDPHPYLPIWPLRLACKLEIPLPASVIVWLGWNRLAPGELSVAPDDVTRAIRVGRRPAALAGAGSVSQTRPLHLNLPAGPVDLTETRPTSPPISTGSLAASSSTLRQDVPIAPAGDPTAAPLPAPSNPATTQAVGEATEAREAAHAITNEPAADLGAKGFPAGDVHASNGSPVAPATGNAPRSPHSEALAAEAKDPPLSADELKEIKAELELIGARLRRPGVSVFDGRFPVYVVFSVKSALVARFGEAAAETVIAAMRSVVTAVQARPNWGACLFLADDYDACTALGLDPAMSIDPWSLKLSLADLDSALARRGEMIGAVLIVGGPEIVPFHLLPNPVDDQDIEVPSDNPYATRDDNYFIPEWPLGRLPEGAEPDPSLLLASLERISTRHTQQAERVAWYTRWLRIITSWLRPAERRRQASFGYTAAIWRQASMSVFRQIGDPGALYVSPPAGVNGSAQGSVNLSGLAEANACPAAETAGEPASIGQDIVSASLAPDLASDIGAAPSAMAVANKHATATTTTTSNGQAPLAGAPCPEGRLGYFNLHGLPDSGEWYGQRDPQELNRGPDYPVALRPDDIGASANRNDPLVPQVIFSEACYGAHITGKTPNQAIALKFLATGAQAIAGSTVMSYGSISAPLIAADLLGHAFWRHLKDGLPAGEALRRAKIHLAHEMHLRQGYLDGEDQKTLIGFILYGDPLAQPEPRGYAPKSIQRTIQPHAQVKTLCGRADQLDGDQPIPEDVICYVKHVVTQYLPGMHDALLTLTDEREQCSGHSCPTSELHAKGFELPEHTRRLITLSKSIRRDHHTHHLVARLTLDEQNKLVKLAVSR